MLKYFDDNISKYTIPKEALPYIVEGLREFYGEENMRIEEKKKALTEELVRIERKLANLLEMRMNAELTSEEYLGIKNGLMDQKFSSNDILSKIVLMENDLLQKAEQCLELLVNLTQTWKDANLFKKAIMIRMICPELFVDTKKALYIKERELFEEARNIVDSVWLSMPSDSRTLERSQSMRRFYTSLLRDENIWQI